MRRRRTRGRRGLGGREYKMKWIPESRCKTERRVEKGDVERYEGAEKDD